MLIIFSALAPPAASTDGATPLKIDKRIEIVSKPEAVWAIVGDFAQIAVRNPLVADSTATFDETQGKERLVTLKSGGSITDALTEYDSNKMTYSYRRVMLTYRSLRYFSTRQPLRFRRRPPAPMSNGLVEFIAATPVTSRLRI